MSSALFLIPQLPQLSCIKMHDGNILV